MAGKLDKFIYGTSHGVRTVWYSAHYAAAMRFAPKIKIPSVGRLPGWHTVYADLNQLLRRDWHNIRDGIYPAPETESANLFQSARRSLAFFRDLSAVNHRRAAGITDEIFAVPRSKRYPPYYLQNFHYQSGGYLTDQSANLYDHQVEVLFVGGADAMRRHALASLIRYLRRFGRLDTNHLDIACGTGRFLKMLKRARPRQRVTGIDLSRPYLREAQRILRPWSRTGLVHGNVEYLPFADQTFQTISCIFLYHELPQKIRPIVTSELARVLKPGGRFFFLDSVQLGDQPDYDGLLKQFSTVFHEPYYDDFIRTNLTNLFNRSGLQTVETDRAFFAKMIVLEKPP